MRDELHVMELVDRYLDGALSEDERRAFEERLRTHGELRQLLDDQRALREGLQRLALRAMVVKAHHGWTWGKWKPFLGGATVVAVAVVGIALARHSPERPTTEVLQPIDTTAGDGPLAGVRMPDVARADSITVMMRDTVRVIEQAWVVRRNDGMTDTSSKVLQPSVTHSQQTLQDEPVAEAVPELVNNAMPAYPGGFEALHRYLKRAIHPPDSVDCGGTMAVRFIVTASGAVTNIEIVHGLNAACDQEALRVLRGMPDWFPAHSYGRPIAGEVNMPLVFNVH